MRVPQQVLFAVCFLVPLFSLRDLSKNHLAKYLEAYKDDLTRRLAATPVRTEGERIILEERGENNSWYSPKIQTSSTNHSDTGTSEKASNRLEQAKIAKYKKDSSSNKSYEKWASINTSSKRDNDQSSPQPAIFLNASCAELEVLNITDVLYNVPIDSQLTPVMFDSNPVGRISSILEHTMCHEKGRFRSIHDGAWNASDEQLVLDWEIKLIYLAIHDFHHKPARDEFRRRCDTVETPYHFECPDAKYLVSPLPDIGMGAGIRLSGVAHVLMAIASDRIPVFVSNAPAGPDFLQARWKLASCDRGDFQCVFMPTTPCQLSISELANATVLDERDAVKLRRNGQLPSQFNEERVLISQPRITPAKLDIFRGIHKTIRTKVHGRVKELLSEWKAKSNSIDTGRWEVLEAAAERIKHGDPPDSNRYQYGHRYGFALLTFF
jgi:hypothetical protein